MGLRDALLRRWQRPEGHPADLLLRPLAWLYGIAVALRRRRFARPGAVERLPVPVIVVGNLIAGGAGKTPAVIAIVELLRRQGWHPGVISRGHGRHGRDLQVLDAASRATDVGDEPLLIHRRAGVPVAVCADRVAAARALLAGNPAIDLLIADDGLQHRRLGRDVEVIVFDDRGAGNGRLLPAGPLREPMPATPPADAIVLYSAGRASTPWPGHLGTRRLAGVVALDDWRRGVPPDPQGWTALRGRPVVAAAGLARPERFFAMLREQALDIVPCPLPDHHDFATPPWRPDARDVVVTEKDAVKLGPQAGRGPRVWVAALDFALPASLADALHLRLGAAPPRTPPP